MKWKLLIVQQGLPHEDLEAETTIQEGHKGEDLDKAVVLDEGPVDLGEDLVDLEEDPVDLEGEKETLLQEGVSILWFALNSFISEHSFRVSRVWTYIRLTIWHKIISHHFLVNRATHEMNRNYDADSSESNEIPKSYDCST